MSVYTSDMCGKLSGLMEDENGRRVAVTVSTMML